MPKPSAFLTGVSGFLGSHTVLNLLEKGYRVIGTLRNLDRVESIKGIIGKYTSNLDQLPFAQADLVDESVWEKLV